MVILETKRCHIVPTPAGTYAFAGSIPFCLGDLVAATRSDVAGGRCWTDNENALKSIKFQAHATAQKAYDFAISRGVKIMSFETQKEEKIKC